MPDNTIPMEELQYLFIDTTGQGGRNGYALGEPCRAAPHHQLRALHALLRRPEAHRRALPGALQGDILNTIGKLRGLSASLFDALWQ